MGTHCLTIEVKPFLAHAPGIKLSETDFHKQTLTKMGMAAFFCDVNFGAMRVPPLSLCLSVFSLRRLPDQDRQPRDGYRLGVVQGAAQAGAR